MKDQQRLFLNLVSIFVKLFEFLSRDQVPLKIGKSLDCHKLGIRLERHCSAKWMLKSMYPIRCSRETVSWVAFAVLLVKKDVTQEKLTEEFFIEVVSFVVIGSDNVCPILLLWQSYENICDLFLLGIHVFLHATTMPRSIFSHRLFFVTPVTTIVTIVMLEIYSNYEINPTVC